MTLTPDTPSLTPPPTSGIPPQGPPLQGPPPQGPQFQGPQFQGPPPRGPQPRRTSSKVVATIAICAGAVLVLGTVATGVVSVVRAATVHTGEVTASAAGLARLDLGVSAAQVTLSYGSVTEATLRVTGGSGADDWAFERDGDTLVASSDRDVWGRWGWFREPDTVELVLPMSAAGLDADIDLDSGSLRADGDFGDLALTLDAGSLSVSGTATTLTSEVNAGSARLDLAGVEEATFSVNAGSVEGSLEDQVPTSVTIDVSAGRLDLTVPAGRYALTDDVSAGRFSHDLIADPTSGNRIDVTVSAGAVELRAD